MVQVLLYWFSTLNEGRNPQTGEIMKRFLNINKTESVNAVATQAELTKIIGKANIDVGINGFLVPIDVPKMV